MENGQKRARKKKSRSAAGRFENKFEDLKDQNGYKRFFSSAPKENFAAIPDKKERFRGAHIIGWLIEGIAVLMFIGAAVLAA